MKKPVTRCIEDTDGGIVHLMEVRPRNGTAYDTLLWCETIAWAWVEPTFAAGPATCLWCLAAERPARLRDTSRD